MDSKYVPVLKNRQEEINALKELYKLNISEKILPLIEIVQEKSRSNLKKNLCQELQSTIKPNAPFMVDILNPSRPRKSKPQINNFFRQLKRNPKAIVGLFNSLSPNKGLIPVISYDPMSYVKIKKEIEFLASQLRIKYSKLAFRLKPAKFKDALSEVRNVITKNDIIILDIEHSNYRDPNYSILYKQINIIKEQFGIQTFIINSVIPESLTNKSFVNGLPIPNIDNSLRDNYVKYGFSGFGDYATIKSSLPPSGGSISPGFIFYSYDTNEYIGFKGRYDKLSEFEQYIIPSLLASVPWAKYNSIHKSTCPGCNHILIIRNAIESGASQGKWKQIAIKHYIFTMYELLP